MHRRTATPAIPAFLILWLFVPAVALAQRGAPPPLPKTPLPQEILTLLTNELSGQMIYNNEVLLAGAPWIRDPKEFSGTLYETQKMYDLVKSYGIENTRIERSPGARTVDYPTEGEFWVMEPGPRLVARLGADAALVASGSSTADVTGELIYVPPLTPDDVKKIRAAGPQAQYKGKLALMWSHVRGDAAAALDAAGLAGVVSFSSRERYFDPDQVVYGGGSYNNPNLKVGLNVSWRQWSELLEDVLSGRKVVVRAKTKIETFPDKFEAVYSWIPGTEPGAKGVIFTGHLFEGLIKRGANDDMSGCVVQLEILRALTRLIASGQLPQPRRTIYFLWPQEISGTYDFIKRHPGIAASWSININMDMVGEALRRNNGLLTMSECPNQLPCYLDGLTKSVMNYVWRTNDIVYLPDAPRGRPGGQYFPEPMVEKNGSDDAFRFFIHRATGGSDHVCFNNPAVAVPGIELFTWPDQWYHADTDTPDKSDPTQMKRIAFIGAASAWAAANCTDDVLAGLLDVVSEFGYGRVAERDLPAAMHLLDEADAAGLDAATARALNRVDFAVDREIGAIRSIEDVYSGSAAAKTALSDRVQQWELYRAGLRGQVQGYAKVRAASLGVKQVAAKKPAPVAKRAAGVPDYDAIAPAIAPSVKGSEFSLNSYEPYTKYLKENPEALKKLGLSPGVATTILAWVNGRRSIATIRNAVAADSGQDVSVEAVAGYLEILKSVKYVAY